jgi:hypothetical protein
VKKKQQWRWYWTFSSINFIKPIISYFDESINQVSETRIVCCIV